jgi:transcriptional regulator with XRE-family HTH domain
VSSHVGTVRWATLAISENRKAYLDELRRRSFFEDTQPASEVLRRRIREYREAKDLSQRALAEAMTDVGLPLTFDRISKIENGVRRVSYDELLGFAFVLGVPLARLMRPPDGEPPIRAGGIGLEQHEVANWLVWGPPTSQDAMGAQTFMRLTLEIQTMMQVVEDERDPAQQREYRRTVVRLMKELSEASGVRPGVIERQALRDEMGDRG